jgi:hypothetical protein
MLSAQRRGCGLETCLVETRQNERTETTVLIGITAVEQPCGDHDLAQVLVQVVVSA